MIIFLMIVISILSILLGFLVYRLIKLNNRLIKLNNKLKMEKMRADVGWEQYHKMSTDRDALRDILGSKNSEISSLKKELSSLKDLNVVPVTRYGDWSS